MSRCPPRRQGRSPKVLAYPSDRQPEFEAFWFCIAIRATAAGPHLNLPRLCATQGNLRHCSRQPRRRRRSATPTLESASW